MTNDNTSSCNDLGIHDASISTIFNPTYTNTVNGTISTHNTTFNGGITIDWIDMLQRLDRIEKICNIKKRDTLSESRHPVLKTYGDYMDETLATEYLKIADKLKSVLDEYDKIADECAVMDKLHDGIE